MTTTELEIFQEIDIDAEVPCDFTEMHKIVGSLVAAKFRVLTRCPYCEQKDYLNICRPCLEGLRQCVFVEHCGPESCGLSCHIDECILEVQEL